MKKLALLIAIIELVACTQSSLSPREYAQYVKNPSHNLHQVTQAGTVSFEVQYKPLQYVCLLENGPTNISSSTLKELESQFDGLSYFTFSIIGSSDPIQSVKDDTALVKKRIDYLSFKANKDFWLLQGDDTLHCVMHHFERNYGVAPREDIVLAFEPLKKSDSNQDITFCYRDGLLGTGYHQFKFKIQDIQSIPTLKTI